MNKRIFEISVGFFIICLAFGWLFYAKHQIHATRFEGYTLVAKFDNADGIQVGSDVKISGVRVGEVTEVKIDPKTFTSVVKFSVEKSVKLPSDTSASVYTNGLMGNKYISISPGGDDDILEPGDEIQNTQGSLNIESLIGKFLFNSKKK